MDLKTIDILLVEDNRADIALIQELLSCAKTVKCIVVAVSRLAQAIEELNNQHFDVILLDLSLPDSVGMETLLKVQEQAPAIPIVVMTGLDDEELAVEAVSLGAQDYLLKTQTTADFLVRSIRYALERKSTLEALRESQARYELLVASGKDYGIFTLAVDGRVVSWNTGIDRILGYSAEEIIGVHFRCFYLLEEIALSQPEKDLQLAIKEGRFEAEGWRVRKDGSQFWAAVAISALRDESGQLRGFAQMMRDFTERERAEGEIRKLHDDLKRRAADLEVTNKELEAFNYSVSHDLRNPLLIIDGMTWVLQQKYGSVLDEQGLHYLSRVRAASKRMEQLIEDLLHLSRVTRSEMQPEKVALSEMVEKISLQLLQAHPAQKIELIIAPGVEVFGDARLLQIVLENLLSNAWKYTAKKPWAFIEFGVCLAVEAENVGEYAPDICPNQKVYFVRDNGAGFSMAKAEKLFTPFGRLHSKTDFEGTGIGLATVQRIIHRHGGRIWAYSEVDIGATFYFTLE
ncbi:PAS domain S-box protein [Ancylothrix sp. C2]|uniref:sensor histidine kinase n=1 Tax=Ancylothrix sp. D3o TaxID=2953691 RepID=UPI0021BA6D90|nr:response regulator [Ancylothrix sp. D3o]MCT7949983.1 PAS domain S-box protein [Ancylothrix sp. D3o]